MFNYQSKLLFHYIVHVSKACWAIHSNFTIKELPKMNHLFQTTETGKISEYGELEETFSPIALEIMSDWIMKVLKE